MIYLKSFLAGVVAVVLGVPTIAVILILGLGFKVIELSRTWPSSPVLVGWLAFRITPCSPDFLRIDLSLWVRLGTINFLYDLLR